MLKTKDGLDLFIQNWTVPESKAILVLTHGYNDHSGRFAHVGQALNVAGYSLYAYDLRGHGQSQGQRGHTPGFNYFLDDLELVIAHARQDAPGHKLFLYGHSMGGNIALNFAIRRPVGLSGVIATGPWLKLAFQPPAVQLAIARLIGLAAPSFSQSSKLNLPDLSRDEKVQEAYRTDPLLHGVISVKLLTEITRNGQAALDHAADMKLPVLLLHGGSDPITSAAATEEFYRSAGSADKTFKRYPNFRHEIHNEFGREEVFTDIIAWLGRH